jgi:hypothetical protein
MKRFHALLMIAAAMLAGCDKTDRTSSGSITGITPHPAAPAEQTLRGIVVPNAAQEIEPRLALKLDDGTLIGLMGGAAAPLASVVGAQVEITGTAPNDLIADATLIEVDRFKVLSVGGTMVSDGTLVLIDGAYSLHLIGGGSRDVPDPPEGLTDHVGERVWLSVADDGSPLFYGVIRAS